MAPERSPPTYLDCIDFWQTPTHPITTIPLKPAPLIRIPCGIAQKSMIVVIYTTASGRRWSPAILAPHWQWLSRLDSEQIYGGVCALGRQLAIMDRHLKPLGGKLDNTVIKIPALECAEHQDFARCQIRLEIGWQVTWCCVQGIAVGTISFKTDTLDTVSAFERG
jgi:hypothetical protein